MRSSGFKNITVSDRKPTNAWRLHTIMGHFSSLLYVIKRRRVVDNFLRHFFFCCLRCWYRVSRQLYFLIEYLSINSGVAHCTVRNLNISQRVINAVAFLYKKSRRRAINKNCNACFSQNHAISFFSLSDKNLKPNNALIYTNKFFFGKYILYLK